MKRIIYIITTVIAGYSATSCTINTNAVVPETVNHEIIFRSRGGIATRSAIDGTAFPQGYDMMVSAFHNVGENAGGDIDKNYFEGILFGYDGTTSAWKSRRGAKYYPLDGTLDFLALASAGFNNASYGIAPSLVWGESSNVAKKVVATVPDNSAKFDDLLYGSANAQALSASGTAMEFKHAMTSVVFTAHCNVAYNSTTNTGITINGITIDGAKYSGTLTVSNPGAGGGSGEMSAVWSSLGSQQDHIAARVWNSANLGTNASESALTALNLTTTSKDIASYPFGEGYVILPPQDAVSFTITYTVHNGFDSSSAANNNTLTYKFVPDGTWDMGKKNVYDIEFNLTEILIVPSIIDWDFKVADINEVEIPDPANGHAYVDLGLRSGGNKILFATCNVGANSPEEYGDYYAWGDVVKRYSSISGTSVIGYSFNWENYLYANNVAEKLTKYCQTAYTNYWDGSGDPDNKTILEQEDDVATIMWGGQWRIMDKSELEYLISTNVTSEVVTNYNSTGIRGRLITGKGEYSSASIFLPFTGRCYDTFTSETGSAGYYWCRTLNDTDPRNAYSLYVRYEQNIYNNSRSWGFSIRPVLVVPE